MHVSNLRNTEQSLCVSLRFDCEKTESSKVISKFTVPGLPPKVTANLNLTCKNIYSKTKNKSNTYSYLEKKSNFIFLKTASTSFRVLARVSVEISNHVFKLTRDYNDEIEKWNSV